jgi:4-hydroxy-3-polyprenylbenzoate decarboxylase
VLKALSALDGVETHLVVTSGARRTWELECRRVPYSQLVSLADVVHDVANLAASISSGSFVSDGMVVAPTSMKTLAGIVCGYTDNLLLRAADVCLKEGRRVVLVPREMPLGKLHLRNLATAADLGCVVVPPLLTFYNGASTVEEQVNHIVGKILRQLSLDYAAFVPWTGVE